MFKLSNNQRNSIVRPPFYQISKQANLGDIVKFPHGVAVASGEIIGLTYGTCLVKIAHSPDPIPVDWYRVIEIVKEDTNGIKERSDW
jgi:hypothetical protein